MFYRSNKEMKSTEKKNFYRVPPKYSLFLSDKYKNFPINEFAITWKLIEAASQ